MADQAELDSCKVTNNQIFCEGQDETYEKLHFADDEVLSDLIILTSGNSPS